MTIEAVEALAALHTEHLGPIFASLTAEEWNLQTPCDGWQVRDLIAHVSSTFRDVAYPAPPPAEGASVDALTAEEGIEVLVTARSEWTPAQILDEYQQAVGGALAALAAMQEEPISSAMIRLADLGEYETHMLANAFAFDHYCHMRFDLLAPHGPVERPLPEPTDGELRPGVEWMLAGLPKMQPGQFGAMVAPVVVELTGPGGGVWTVSPSDGGNVEVTEGDDGGVTSRAVSTAHSFVSWGTTRSSWRDHVSVEGDDVPVTSFLDVLNII